MKKSFIVALFSCVVGLLATSAHAADFSGKVDVCLIPLPDLVMDSVKNIVRGYYHVYLQTDDGTTKRAFNFEPIDKNNFMGGLAIVGDQIYSSDQYPNLNCFTIVTSNNRANFDVLVDNIAINYAEEMDENYALFTHNCLIATEKVMQKLNLIMPQNVLDTLKNQKAIQEKCVIQ